MDHPPPDTVKGSHL